MKTLTPAIADDTQSLTPAEALRRCRWQLAAEQQPAGEQARTACSVPPSLADADQKSSAHNLIGDCDSADERRYDSFGSTVPVIFIYTGEMFDQAELQNDLARWYDPATGRWLSQDPLGLGPDTSPYRYVKNDPLGYRDPLGLSAEDSGSGDGTVELMAWHVERNKNQRQARVWSDDPQHDTVESLAKLIGLDPKQAKNWLKKKWNSKTNQWEWFVPNTIIVYWAAEYDKTGQAVVRWKREIKYLEDLGFNVVKKQYGEDKNNIDQWDANKLLKAMKDASAAGELYGFYFWGHGLPNCISSEKVTATSGFYLEYADIVAAMQYGLGFVLVNACFGNFKKGDKLDFWLWSPRDPLNPFHYVTPPGGLVNGGHDLISGTGKFHGADGVEIPFRLPEKIAKPDILTRNPRHPWEIVKPGDFGTDSGAKVPTF
jgi:RHS repeat-associated protein